MTEGEPQLRYEENVRMVDCHDLDDFVAIHLDGYDVSWRSLETGYDGYHNGSFATADVAPGKEPDWDDGQDFGRWLLGGEYHGEDAYTKGLPPDIEAMLQWLCDLGKIPAGKYVVKLWW